MVSDSSDVAEYTHPEQLPIYCVVDMGVVHSDLTKMDVTRWRRKPCDVLLDYTRNKILLKCCGTTAHTRITLAQRGGVVTTAWEMLRVMAEDPGTPFTAALFALRFGACPLESQTIAKYISTTRSVLRDDAKNPRFILTDKVLTSAGKASSAYCCSEQQHWRVIRYVNELSNPDFNQVIHRRRGE